MADKKFSALDPVVSLDGTEIVPVIKGGVPMRTSVDQILTRDTDPVASVNGQTGVVVLTQDSVGDGTTNKQYTSTEKTKLAGIATGATVNDTDANLKSRSNHTGTQTASTISDFNTAADARVAVHTSDATDAHAASSITNTPAGNIIATTVQAAINELDTEKAATNHTHSGLVPSGGTSGQVLKKNTGTDYDYSWAADSTGAGGGTPGGSDTQIQFNDGGALGGDADLVWNKTTNDFILGGTNTGITMNGITNEPSAPSSGTLRYYTKAIAGRMMPKIKGPSGLDTVMQTALFQNRVLMYVPSTGTTGTGSGTGLGPVWTSGGTVTHPTPASTAPAISNQMRRTRYANVVTTTNQTLGIKAAAADTLNYWRGNAAGLGGFFYAARFIVELYPASTVRIFAGLTASSTTYVVASDTVLNNTCGLWHDTTDPSTGAGAFNFVTRDGTTTTKQQITLSNAIAAGNSYDFYMWCAPNGSTIYWRLDDIVNNVTYEGSTSTTLPASTAFMGPQCAMSNGTANITVTTTAIGIASVYTEADR